MNEIASRYAQALYSIAYDRKQILEMQNEVKELRKIFIENPDFSMVLGSNFLSPEERKAIVDRDLKGVDKDIINLIKVLIDNNRTNILNDVLQGFNSYCNEYRGVDEGIVYSTIPLEEKTKTEIEKKISEIEGVQVELINHIDPKLIGGVKVVINDHIYDGTVKNQLESLRKSLLRKEK